MTAESSSRDNGNIWVIVPFALAIVGTVVMLFTNSANALKISLILALWAAAAGLIIIFKTRRDRDEATRALEASEAQHKEELARLEARPAPAAPSVDEELLRELQSEIKALRSQLEEMSGQVFEYEPAAVRAAARRIQEIEQAGAAPDTWAKDTAAQPSEAVQPVEEPVHEPVASFREPQAAPKTEPKPEPKAEAKGPSTYETAKITRVTSEHTAAGTHRTRPSGAPSSDAVAGKIGQMPQRDQPNPLSALISERAKAEAEKPAQPAQPEKPAEPEKPEKPETPEYVGRHEQPAQESTGGRRRRDAGREGALSVAELIARSKRS
ncbi:DUF6779 domain-containing protein [Corynebacterium sp. HMSC071B10]|uniref:DUF6779 domain-containing protein n=1 Tax=Corynebacterium sp. HMSC071B10 TaxID=1739494 RepID=UPI0008A37D59|nr:DUF6779 domain-containing protein [Corynebacterium sp. HMSC071B10]OFP35429.1 hypothetical protein HMPREF2990_09015 [Corynebacterium sp. HMSC071B10]